MGLRVAITTSSFGGGAPDQRQRLEKLGFEVADNPYGRKLTEDESVALLDGAVGVIAGTSPLSVRVLDAAQSLQVISRVGVGVDSVDLEAVRARGISLHLTLDAPTDGVAELTIGLILTRLRGIATADRRVREGRWKAYEGSLLQGKTVGLVGLGRIGQSVAHLLQPFGVRLLAADPVPPPPEVAGKLSVELVDLDRLLQESHIVSLHVPLVDTTRHLIGADQLARMRRGAVLVNASRGGLVDESALLEALDAGSLGGAALDTFKDEPYDGPLTARADVLLTCHMGSAAVETRARMEAEAVDNLVAGLQDKGLLPEQ